MATPDGNIWSFIGILAVLGLVAANGFFVAAEFSLVAVRRSRVVELVSAGRPNAAALQKALGNLDANLAATQLGITISSLALGWIGEPAISHLIEPALSALGSFASAGAESISIAIAFTLITALHIVLGELAPKSLALQRSEGTALSIVRPLSAFLFLFRPAIVALNSLGMLVLKAFGLQSHSGEESLHSADELKLLVRASHEAGILEAAQQEVMVRTLNIGQRRVGDIMTPRVDVDWIDANDSPGVSLQTIRACRHEQLLVGRESIDEPLGMVLKKDILDQLLDGALPDPMTVIRQPLVVHEMMPIFKILERFKQSPTRLVMVVDEYGVLAGIVTQTDLLEAIAGDLPDTEGEEKYIVEQPDGALVFDGRAPVQDAFEKLVLRMPEDANYHTIAGFALVQLGQIPTVGQAFRHGDWRFEIVRMDGPRIAKLLAQRDGVTGPSMDA